MGESGVTTSDRYASEVQRRARTQSWWPRVGDRKREVKSPVADWQRALAKVYATAGVPEAHAHQSRDTFAVELLLSGVPLERVSVLLGHSSVKITERHYAPWVRERQEQLEEDVRRAWKGDPLLNRTNPVQREKPPRKLLKTKQ
jgi:integrase